MPFAKDAPLLRASRRSTQAGGGESPLPDAFEWRAGIHVTGSALFCDTPRTHDLCFLSSAQVLMTHTETFAPMGQKPKRRGSESLGAVLCSEKTWRLHQALHPRAVVPPGLLLSPTGRPFQLGQLRLELFPSGALYGAASLWMKLPSTQTVIYAGAANPSVRFAALAGSEPMQVRQAEALLLLAPLAIASTPLPDVEEAQASLWKVLCAAEADGAATVLLCPSLSTAPAIAELLCAAENTPARAIYGHPFVGRACKLSRRGRVQRFGRPLGAGEVLLWPLSTECDLLPAHRLIQGDARRVRIHLLTAAALLPDVVAAYRAMLAEAGWELASALPFPDAIDRPGLLSYLATTEARKLYLPAGYSEELAAALAKAYPRVEVTPLGPPRQLPLGLG